MQPLQPVQTLVSMTIAHACPLYSNPGYIYSAASPTASCSSPRIACGLRWYSSKVPERMMPRFPRTVRVWGVFLVLWLAGAFPSPVAAQTIARCGQGWLERIDGYPVLHLKGSPYEMGYQQGTLLNDDCKSLFTYLFDSELKKKKIEYLGVQIPVQQAIAAIFAAQRPNIPARYIEEMQGLADALQIDAQRVFAANSIPGEVRVQHLDRDAVLRYAVVRLPDGREATAAHGLHEAVSPVGQVVSGPELAPFAEPPAQLEDLAVDGVGRTPDVA